ncbi:MAG: hypothetical protein QOF00_2483 [Pseudonocardiales bacterium]|nr:hypothetical protein [Pseudonocardiales bacterium]
MALCVANARRSSAQCRWRTVIAAVGLAVITIVGLAVPAAAQPAADGPPSPVFVEFDQPSALQEYDVRRGQGAALAQGAARAARALITETTDSLLAAFRGAEGTSEIFRTSNAIAGVALEATPQTMRALASRPGVKSVRRITPARISDASGDQLGRVAQAWQQTGRLGTGVRIGVIDTGIDYTHADFGGSGTAAAYKAVNPTRVDPATFPTAKVVGGVDLAGDDYDADSTDPARTVPVPDANPIDCEGHGSHVAGIAAGYGVTADGATFRGDYSRLTPAALDRMRIGPGAAPGASLYAIRVFGCSGSTALTPLGLDRALDPNDDGDFSDRLDVVNLSLGSSFGAVDDPVNDFVHVLTANGVLVVAAAGNGGDVYDAGGSPGNSPDAIGVASVRDAGTLLDGVEVQAPSSLVGALAGQYSQAYGGYATLDVSGPVVAPAATDAEGCDPYEGADAPRVRGAVVWLEWDDDPAKRACGSATRADNALAAGAVGVLLTSAMTDFGAGEIEGDAGIPVVRLTAPATAALRPHVGEARVRLAGALRKTQQVSVSSIEDSISDFSSRGMRGPTVKPDVAAPGESITSAESGSGNDRVSESGTSMASPFVAGVAALLLEGHPGWTPAEVKTAIMNTADPGVWTGENHTGLRLAPMRVGAGRIDAAAALATSVLAGNADEPGAVSVTFGTVEVPPGQPYEARQRIRVRSFALMPARLAVAYEPVTRMPGVSIDVTPSEVTAMPGRDATVEVTLRIDDPTALRRTADPTLALEQEGQARDYLADASGRVILTPDDGHRAPVRVPVSASPKPVSALTATLAGDAVTLHGTGVDQGTGREAYRSRVGVFALATTSPELPVCLSATAVSGCVANATGRGGDVREVGLTSTVAAARAAGSPGAAMLGIAVATWADLYNVGSLTLPEAQIDTDGDGRADFSTTLVTIPDTDDLVARTVDLHALPERTVDIEPVNGFDGATDTNVFDTNAWVLPVHLAALRIDPSAASAPLHVRVVVHGEYGPPGGRKGLVDTTAVSAPFDPMAPLVTPAAGADPSTLLLPADDGTTLTVPGAATTPLLVLLGQNGTGKRVSVLGGPPPLLPTLGVTSTPEGGASPGGTVPVPPAAPSRPASSSPLPPTSPPTSPPTPPLSSGGGRPSSAVAPAGDPAGAPPTARPTTTEPPPSAE